MKKICILPCPEFKGEISLPGDKSLSHRVVILSAITSGRTHIKNFLRSDDTLSTLNIFRQMGLKLLLKKDSLIIKGRGKRGLKRPSGILDCKESGTTMRLLAGLLSPQKFPSLLVGSKGLSRRPMARITKPLRMMKARIEGRKEDKEEYPPLRIEPVKVIQGIDYRLPVSSAQVKSCLLLASLYAHSPSVIKEKFPSRDHTERLLKFMGAKIKIEKEGIRIENSSLRSLGYISLPGDFSSAAYFLALTLLKKNSYLYIKDVGINPTRTGLLRVLERMSSKINLKVTEKEPEPRGDIEVFSSSLKATTIERREIPSLIDELPLFMVIGTQAEGVSIIKGCEELKVKETDRIHSLLWNLKKMGARISLEREKQTLNIYIKGPTLLKGSTLRSFSDHRTCLSIFVASCVAKGRSSIDGMDCISKSFPQFLFIFQSLFKK